MVNDWAAVDTLIRDLGAAVSAATYVRGDVARATADLAIREASQAVNEIISSPSSRTLLASAREAVRTAHDVIHALDREVARSRALRASGRAISARAMQLIEQAAARRSPTPHEQT
jgi:hypothetical protein